MEITKDYEKLEEEFIIKFYSCDNEEQFLKDIHHSLNLLQQENQQLKEKNEEQSLLLIELHQRINKALNKIENMFDIADVNKFLDDLLELEKILKGE